MTAASDQGDARAVTATLEAERERLQALLADVIGSEDLDRPQHASAGGELSMEDQHPADAATDTQYREQSLSEAIELRARIEEVDDALRKLDDGTYGICEACGRPIGAERLEALPATRFCIDDAHLAEAEAAHPVTGESPEGAAEGTG